MVKAEQTHMLHGVQTEQILNVVCATMDKMDARLVSHGQRVAYLTHALWEADGAPSAVDPNILCIASLMHDIGAYRMQEIDSLLEFDAASPIEHCIAGYCFLKYFSPLGEAAEIVLYHHLPYPVYEKAPGKYLPYCAYISFADRVDIGLSVYKKSVAQVLKEIERDAFAPRMPALLERAQAAFSLEQQLRSGTYRTTVTALLERVPLSPDIAVQYLQQIVYSIDFRSVYTTTHTLNIGVLATQLGQRMGLSQQECQELYLAALLHDLGKIAVPVEILEDTGRLSQERMGVMRSHVEYTEDIISGLVSEKLCRIAVRHHEKLDGSGYPRGLRGEEMTLQERILAVADIFSALTGQRSYKDAFSREKTLRILDQMAQEGKLDAEVCAVVQQHYDEMMHAVQVQRGPVLENYEKIQRESAVQSSALQALLRGRT